MNTNVYEPPKADLGVERNPGSVVKAVAVGSLIEIVGTFVAGLIVVIVYGIHLASQGMSPQEMQSRLVEFDPWSGYVLASVLLGMLVSVLAGYVCARIANTTSYRSAYIMSGISCALGMLSGIGSYAWWVLVILGALTVFAVLFGARLYIQKLRTAGT